MLHVTSFNPHSNLRGRNYHRFYKKETEVSTSWSDHAGYKKNVTASPKEKIRSNPIFKIHYRAKERL